MSSVPPRDWLIFRFSLYGFLKNQQYYEPFFLLVLRSKGLSFFEIGLLYAFREICVNLMGIPAGFVADVFGRRSAMVLCFIAYILSFAGFSGVRTLGWLYVSMFAFALGESFRTGTHKAMVFHYLRLTGREAEKAVVYGKTRSWSKVGSAVSSLLSGGFVLLSGSYAQTFLYCIPPYLLNVANVASYPKALEGETAREVMSARRFLGTMWQESLACVRNRRLRVLFFESAMLQAVAKSVKEYVQPLVVTAFLGLGAVGTASQLGLTGPSAAVLGGLYFVLNLVAAFAARYSHRLDGIERRRFPWLWSAVALVGALLAIGSLTQGLVRGAVLVAVSGFVLLVLLENLWRPLFLDRLDDASDSRYGAAVLSVEAQFSSLGVMLGAPLAGRLADAFGLTGVGLGVTAVALAIAGITGPRRYREGLPGSRARQSSG